MPYTMMPVCCFRVPVWGSSLLLGLLTLVSLPVAATSPVGVRFDISQDGLYAISAGELTRHGVDLPVARSQVRLLAPEGEVHVWFESLDAEQFGTDASDRVVFYGMYPRGTTTTRRILNDSRPYRLVVNPGPAIPGVELDSEPWRYEVLTADEARARWPTPQPVNVHLWRVRIEHDYGYNRWTGISADETDFYYFRPLSTAENYEVVIDRIHMPSMVPPPAGREDEFHPRLRMKLYGISQTRVPDEPDHLVEVLFNGTLIGTAIWNGISAHEWETTIPLDLLPNAGPHTVVLRTPESRADIIDQMYLDWIEIAYPRSMFHRDAHATHLRPELMEDPEGNGLLLTSLNWDPTIETVRLLDPQAGRIYEPVEMRADVRGDATRHRFRWIAELPTGLPHGPDPFNGSPVLLAFSAEAIAEVQNIRPWHPRHPLESLNTGGDTLVQQLIITHHTLMNEVNELAVWRKAEGLLAEVVDVQDIFDAYSDGYHHRQAVVDFLREAMEHPAGSRLRYLLLFGNSTYDYKGIQERNHPERRISGTNLLPLYYSEAGHWNRAVYPADHLFVANPSDVNRALLAVGRVPASTPREARAYIEKVREYELSALARRHERHRALLVSSWETSFKSLLDEIVRLMPRHDSTLLIAEVDEYDESVANLMGELNNGTDVLYYVGHGGSFVWRVGPVDFQRQKDLFTSGHINALTNRGHYPLVFVSSCYTVSFDHARSLGEEFILTPGAGAIGVVGSPWKTSVSPNHLFNREMIGWLYDSLSRERIGSPPPDPTQVRLGDAFFAVKNHANWRGEAHIGFTLLGDPALRVVPPEEPPAKPGDEPAE